MLQTASHHSYIMAISNINTRDHLTSDHRTFNNISTPSLLSSPSESMRDCGRLFLLLWICVFMGLVSVLGYIGNVLTLLVLHLAKRSNVTLFLLKTLAYTDLLYVIVYRYECYFKSQIQIQVTFIKCCNIASLYLI